MYDRGTYHLWISLIAQLLPADICYKKGAPVGAHLPNVRNLGTTPIKTKRSRSEKAILGATLGIPGYSRSNSRNGTHDLIYVKTLFSERLSERLSELVGRQDFSPNSRSVYFKIGVAPARQKMVGCQEAHQEHPSLRGPRNTDLRAQSLCVGVPLLFQYLDGGNSALVIGF